MDKPHFDNYHTNPCIVVSYPPFWCKHRVPNDRSMDKSFRYLHRLNLVSNIDLNIVYIPLVYNENDQLVEIVRQVNIVHVLMCIDYHTKSHSIHISKNETHFPSNQNFRLLDSFPMNNWINIDKLLYHFRSYRFCHLDKYKFDKLK